MRGRPAVWDYHSVSAIPDFITHYHLPDRDPFLNLSDLADESVEEILAGLAAAAEIGSSERRFGPRYMKLRRRTEELLRARFIGVGGRPVRQSPHYFVLGESEWFRGLYHEAREVRNPFERRADASPEFHLSRQRDLHGSTPRVRDPRRASAVSRQGLQD
jgi:hypothetical protein